MQYLKSKQETLSFEVVVEVLKYRMIPSIKIFNVLQLRDLLELF